MSKNTKTKLNTKPDLHGRTARSALWNVALEQIREQEGFRAYQYANEEREKENESTPHKFDGVKPITSERALDRRRFFASRHDIARHELESIPAEDPTETQEDFSREPNAPMHMWKHISTPEKEITYDGPDLGHLSPISVSTGRKDNSKTYAYTRKSDAFGDIREMPELMHPRTLKIGSPVNIPGRVDNIPPEFWLEVCLKRLGF